MNLFASDFDGTLFFKGREPSFRTDDMQAVAAFQKLGGLFGVCTGRSQAGITVPVKSMPLHFDFYILASGALVLDGDLQVIDTCTIPKALVAELYDRFRGEAEIVIQANDTVYSFCKSSPMQTLISDVQEIPGDRFYGLSFGTDREEAARHLAQCLNENYGDMVRAFVNVRHVDLVRRDCSKGTALQKAAAYFGAGRSGGIGDSYNDIPLLAACDTAYTFHRAPYCVRAQADVLVDTVAEALHDFSSRDQR